MERRALAAAAADVRETSAGAGVRASAGADGHGGVAAERPVDGVAPAELGMLLLPAVGVGIAVEAAAADGPAGTQRSETMPMMPVARVRVHGCSHVDVHASAKVNGHVTWGAEGATTRGAHVRWRSRRTHACVPQGPTLLEAVAGTMLQTQLHHRHAHVRVLHRATRQTKKVQRAPHTRASARTNNASESKEHSQRLAQQVAVHSPEQAPGQDQTSEYRQAGHQPQEPPQK